MKYLIDSDVVADYLKGIPLAVQQVSAIARSDIGISIITYGEIYDGIDGSYDPKEAEAVFRTFLRLADVLPLNRSIMRQFASVRRHLRSRGQLIQDMDMLIAATALHHNLILMTRNLSHFERIPSIMLYP